MFIGKKAGEFCKGTKEAVQARENPAFLLFLKWAGIRFFISAKSFQIWALSVFY